MTPAAPLPPSQNVIHEWALAYLTNRPASVAQMKKVLHRRIDGWARRMGKTDADAEAIEAGVAVAQERALAVIDRLTSSGLLNDVTYAKQRAERLTREGKSRRAVTFDLARKGIANDLARASVSHDPATELTAAVALVRKKRLGAFSRKDAGEIDAKERHRWLGALARAGYSFSVADRALKMDREAAEELLRARR